jgi:MYND finger
LDTIVYYYSKTDSISQFKKPKKMPEVNITEETITIGNATENKTKRFVCACFNGIYIGIGIKMDTEIKDLMDHHRCRFDELTNDLFDLMYTMHEISNALQVTKLTERQWCFRDQRKEIIKAIPALMGLEKRSQWFLQFCDEENEFADSVLKAFIAGTVKLSMLTEDTFAEAFVQLQVMDVPDFMDEDAFLNIQYTCAKQCYREDCHNKATLQCSCRSVRYCSRECQKADWKKHKVTCEFKKK